MSQSVTERYYKFYACIWMEKELKMKIFNERWILPLPQTTLYVLNKIKESLLILSLVRKNVSPLPVDMGHVFLPIGNAW